MKKNSQHPRKTSQHPPEKQPSPFFLALVLTGIIALEMYPAVIQTANADSGNLPSPYPQVEGKKELPNDFDARLAIPKVSDRELLPRTVLVSFKQKLENSQPKILSLMTVDDRLAQGGQNRANELPPQVAAAIRQDLSKQTGIAVGRLKINEFSRQSWPNTCLGMPKDGELCGQMIVEGWRVVLSDGKQTWVYRSDRTGKVLRRENQINSVQPVKIPAAQLPPPLTKGMVFRAIASGGITGRTYETVLMEDGTLMRVLAGPGNANDSGRQVFRVSVQQVKQFQDLLKRLQLARFNQLSYPAPTGAADIITVTFTSTAGTTQYADINRDRLPKPLQDTIEAWSQIIRIIQ
ncbi:MAG TPA: hypothetical protein VK211_20670 [Kamptonema sp.]|nr:hypothetical protein [Kamptonema sp.]